MFHSKVNNMGAG